MWFQFLAFFRSAFDVSYMQIQQTKIQWNIEVLLNHFFAIFKILRPVTFETETRDFKICAFILFFLKLWSSLLSWFFFKFLAFFWPLFDASCLHIQQIKSRWNIEVLINHFLQYSKYRDLQPSRPRLAKMGPETSSLKRGAKHPLACTTNTSGCAAWCRNGNLECWEYMWKRDGDLWKH